MNSGGLHRGFFETLAASSSYDLLPLLGDPRSDRRQVLWLATLNEQLTVAGQRRPFTGLPLASSKGYLRRLNC